MSELSENKSFVLVIHHKGRTWVKEDAKWDADWKELGISHTSNKENKFMFDRSKALTLAHNIQNRAHTEHGVWEVFLKDEANDKKKGNGV